MTSDLDRFFAELESAEFSAVPQRSATAVATTSVTLETTPLSDTEERPYWHCGGTGQCDCITCGRFETHAVWRPGRCVPCKARGRERVQ
jgi:hypothetical protein